MDPSGLSKDTLQLLVSDLSRRLENANNTIDAQKKVAKNSVATAERCRRHFSEVSVNLKLEIAKSESQRRQKLKEDEANNFESTKKRKRIIQEKLRMAELDYQISPSKKASQRIDRMKAQLAELESNQESQKRLLTHLVNIEQMTEDLSLASQNSDFNSCQLLLKRGAGLNDVDSAGFLPLHYACASGSHDIAIEIAARNGKNNVIQILLSFGASVEDKGNKSTPPLISAAMNDHIDCVVYLLSSGANINAIDSNVESALHVATRLEDPMPMVLLLLREGADFDRQNLKGQTPLDIAVFTKNTDLLKILGVE